MARPTLRETPDGFEVVQVLDGEEAETVIAVFDDRENAEAYIERVGGSPTP